MNKFVLDIERNFVDNFYVLLTEQKKEELYQNLKWKIDIDNMKEKSDILKILDITLEDIIIEILHYNLDVYIEVFKDDLNNTIPYYLMIWKVFSWSFYWIEIDYNNWYYKTNIIIWNKRKLDDSAEEILKKQVWEKAYNDILLFSNDLLLYDEYTETYATMANPFEENYSNKKIYIDVKWKLIYINSTILPENFNIK